MKKPEQQGYLGQLDGLRAVAVVGVLVQHYFFLHPEPTTSFAISLLQGTGYLGVRLFFVLSGFLITGILLDGRTMVDGGLVTRGSFLRRFYIRRFLRIFPVYYATLFIAAILNLGSVRREFLWHLAYLSNMLFAVRGSWGDWVNHFWSLAVEEQFYLLWPWLMVLVPRKWLGRVIVAAILGASLYRGIGTLGGWNLLAVQIPLPGCLDSLGLGSLLALAWRSPSLGRRELNRHLDRGAVLGASIVAARFAFSSTRWVQVVYDVTSDLAWALIFCWVIHRASEGTLGRAGRILEWRPARYVGKISYAVYLFHLFAPPTWAFLGSKMGFSMPEAAIVRFALFSGSTVLLASISWRVFESPINDLKTRFPYVSARQMA